MPNPFEKPYQPSPEEVEKAKEIMDRDQTEKSAVRDRQLSIENIKNVFENDESWKKAWDKIKLTDTETIAIEAIKEDREKFILLNYPEHPSLKDFYYYAQYDEEFIDDRASENHGLRLKNGKLDIKKEKNNIMANSVCHNINYVKVETYNHDIDEVEEYLNERVYSIEKIKEELYEQIREIKFRTEAMKIETDKINDLKEQINLARTKK